MSSGSSIRTYGPDALPAALYLVGTPLGNLDDITLRALHVLRKATLIAAEDTRRIRKLLNAFDINAKTISYREENHAQAGARILKLIASGESVALVSDAGMPGISDPGTALVRDCKRTGLAVEVVPGPAAVTAAVSLAGFGADRFVFLGFPPSRQSRRQRFFREYANLKLPLVMYEAPHRIAACLADLQQVLGDREALLMRELTKVHEEVIGDTLSAISEKIAVKDKLRGELTLVIAAPGEKVAAVPVDDSEIKTRYQTMLAEGLKPNEALKLLAAETQHNRKELYKLLRT